MIFFVIHDMVLMWYNDDCCFCLFQTKNGRIFLSFGRKPYILHVNGLTHSTMQNPNRLYQKSAHNMFFCFFLIFSSLHCLCFHLNIISLLLVATFDIICRQTHVDLMLEFVVFSFPKRAGLYLRVSCHDMFVPTRRVMCNGGGEGECH